MQIPELTSELEGDSAIATDIKTLIVSNPSKPDFWVNKGKFNVRSTSGDVGGPGERGARKLSKVNQGSSGDLTTGNDGQEVGRGSTSPGQGNRLALNNGGLERHRPSRKSVRASNDGRGFPRLTGVSMLMLWAKAVAAKEAKATRVEKTFIVRRGKGYGNDVRAKGEIVARGISMSALWFVYITILLSRRCLGIGSSAVSAVPSNVQGDSIPTLRWRVAGTSGAPRRPPSACAHYAVRNSQLYLSGTARMLGIYIPDTGLPKLDKPMDCWWVRKRA